MLQLLSKRSNAECDRSFSTVKKMRTKFRSSLSSKTLSDLLMMKGHETGHNILSRYIPIFGQVFAPFKVCHCRVPSQAKKFGAVHYKSQSFS